MTDHTIAPINYIERKPNSDKYRIVDKGITVDFLALFVHDPEWPVERIAEQYGLTPAEIYAAWSFYYDHKAAIDQRRAESRADADQNAERKEAIKRRYEARTGHPYVNPDVD